ncbi:uncharacterized protein [Hemitrygon akajei]|uniref:uncharacterized protein isoform X2 n=1 Tax=Hemitrygon akajei TaxID=2704970 RepID=UPI003BFA193E
MCLQLLHSKLSTGLMFSFLVVLLPSVTPGRSPNHIYFSNSVNEIRLEGPDNPENGVHVLKWKPHSGQHTQKLVTFSRSKSGRWTADSNDHLENIHLYRAIRTYHSISTRILHLRFGFAGLYTLFQLQPLKKIVKEYEVFGLKVEVSPEQPVVGSDVTLSCTISRLPDTVSLHWKPMVSSQQNRRNTDHIRLNNTVYLMVRHVTVEDGKLYQCEVRENGNVVFTSKADFAVKDELYQSQKTIYRSGTGNSELNLICFQRTDYWSSAKWIWNAHLHQIQNREVMTASRSQSVQADTTYFRNRMVTTELKFNGNDFSASIVPVLSEDAGVYKCYMESVLIVTIELITVKVTAEPSDSVTQGDTIILSCSVSKVTESVRLLWINDHGKTVLEKTLKGEEKSMSLMIKKFDKDRWSWKCGLFHQDRLQLLVPYYLDPSGNGTSIYFFHKEGNFVLKGPDNPGNSSIDLEWSPHTGQQTTKRLATFYREDQWWAVQWSDENSKTNISRRLYAEWGTHNLRIQKPIFEIAGLFIWNQTQSDGSILRQCEIFGVKVEADSQRPAMGSDVTLSCTISRLPDTVSLRWKPVGSSQQNRRNTDQIRLNNTVYLMVRHVGTGDPSLYTWEVQENGSIVLTGDINVGVDKDLHMKAYTIYRSDKDHSELDLICKVTTDLSETKWTWRSQHFWNEEKKIASTYRSEPIKVNRTYFGNRLVAIEGNLNDTNFNLKIIPLRFEDAGVYTCSLQALKYVTIELITLKVTAEPPDAVPKGDTVTLTCSVSRVTESIRLVWVNSSGEILKEKTFMEKTQEEKSLQLNVAEAAGDRRKWSCGLFHQNTPKIFIPYYLKVKRNSHSKQLTVVITGVVAFLLIIILVTVLYLRKCKLTGLERQKQSKGNIQEESNLYSNANELHQIQRANKTPSPESDHFAGYSTVNNKPSQEDTEEDIHYGSISFRTNAPGHRQSLQSANQPSKTNLVSSKEDHSPVIYAQIAQTNI